MPSVFEGKTVMVTGGAGFIGRHLVRRLVEAGAAKVVVLDAFRHGEPERIAGTAPVRFTLGVDAPSALFEPLAGIDLLFHFAAEKHRSAHDDPARALQANVVGTHALLDAAARQGVRKVVFASSLYAYGRDRGPAMVETEVPRPATVYGISKLFGEHLLAHFRAQGGPEFVALRYFFVYGPGQERGAYPSVIVRNLERLRAGQPAAIRGDGKQALDYVYVDDAVAAALAAMGAPVSGEVVNIGSGEPATVLSLIGELIRAAGGPSEPIHEPADQTAGSSRVADVGKAERLLGWRARTSLVEGLERTCRAIPAKATA